MLEVEMNGDRSMLSGRPSPLPLEQRLPLTPSPLENVQAHFLSIRTPGTSRIAIRSKEAGSA